MSDTGLRRATSGPSRPAVSPADASADMARFIRVQCIVRREPTLEQLASQSGVALDRLRRLINLSDTDPRRWRLDEFLSVAAVLRAPAISAATARLAIYAVDDTVDDEPTLSLAVAELCQGGAVFAKVAADLKISEREVRAVQQAASVIQRVAGVFLRAVGRRR